MSQDWPATSFGHLWPGATYVVVRAFRDFDGDEHSVGEIWTFVGSSFLPYDDGLSLFVTVEGERRHIRMQWREDAQGEIIDNLNDYVQAKK
jgi:hypothetical protein